MPQNEYFWLKQGSLSDKLGNFLPIERTLLIDLQLFCPEPEQHQHQYPGCFFGLFGDILDAFIEVIDDVLNVSEVGLLIDCLGELETFLQQSQLQGSFLQKVILKVIVAFVLIQEKTRFIELFHF